MEPSVQPPASPKSKETHNQTHSGFTQLTLAIMLLAPLFATTYVLVSIDASASMQWQRVVLALGCLICYSATVAVVTWGQVRITEAAQYGNQ